MQTAAAINFAGGVVMRRGWQPPPHADRSVRVSRSRSACGSNEKRVRDAPPSVRVPMASQTRTLGMVVAATCECIVSVNASREA